jgi:hypothetical protein
MTAAAGRRKRRVGDCLSGKRERGEERERSGLTSAKPTTKTAQWSIMNGFKVK